MPRKKKIKVVAYTRVSTKAEAQKTSIQNQPKYFQSLFKRPEINDNYELVNIYPEWGATGTNLNRKVFKEMLKDAGIEMVEAKAKDIPHPKYPQKTIKQVEYNFFINTDWTVHFEEIWVKSTSRFARNIDGYKLLMLLRKNGVYVCFLDHNLTTRKDGDLKPIRSLLDNDMYYSEALSRTMRMAKEQAIEEGKLNTSGQLYGYDYHKRTKDNEPYYKINEKEAEVVREIFTSYAGGLGTRAIASMLNKKGTKNRKGKNWSSSSLKKLMSNEKLMGFLNNGKHTTGELFNKFTSPIVTDDYRKHLHKSDYVPGIVSQELWYECDKLRKERAKKYKTNNDKETVIGLNKSRAPYSYLLTCGYCCSSFRHDVDNGKEFYSCSLKETKGIEACNCNNVHQDKLDELVERLKQSELNFLIHTDAREILTTLFYLIEECINEMNKPKDFQKLEEAKNRVNQYRAQLDILYKQQQREFADQEILEKQLTELELMLRESNNDVTKYSKTPSNYTIMIQDLLKMCYPIIELAKSLKDTYDTDEVLEKIEKIIVYGETKNNRLSKQIEHPEFSIIVSGKSGKNYVQPILIPIIKETEKARALINLNLPTFNQRLRDGIPDDDTFRVVHEAEIIKGDNMNYQTKSHWEKTDYPYLLSTNAYYTQDGSEYVKNLGVIGISIMDQLKTKLKELEDKANNMFERYNNLDN